MKWASAVAVTPQLDDAVSTASSALHAQLGNDAADLVIVFVSAHYAVHFEHVPKLVAAQFPSARLIGCSAGGVIGGGKEVEQRPGFSMTAAVLPDVDIVSVHADADSMPKADDAPAQWHQWLGVPAEVAPHFLLLPDPFSFDPDVLIHTLDKTYPGSRTIGGLASGAHQAGENMLFLDQKVYRSGLVGVALAGNITVDTIVAQGCRPIGQPMFVTKCQRNVLWELDGRPVFEVLQELFEGLSVADQGLVQHSLFLGIVMNEHQHEYRQGDFLIRNLVGMDQARGAIAVGAILQENAVVQFHLRDAQTSADDLELLLGRYQSGNRTPPRGALLFSCLGRGQHLYGCADHDTDAFRRHLGEVPLGGFFCNGEIGPVHGTTFLHGYTSAFGLFREKDEG